MNSGNPYLSTQGLDIGYTGKVENRLFSDLHLSLNAGELICFMGPNGAGKSSLLRTLAGLQKALSGKIIVHTLQSHAPMEHQIAVVLTERVHAANLTVEEVIKFGRYPYIGWDIRLSQQDIQIVEAAIQQVHLRPLLRKKIYELSDGQLQMVMIARALAQDTPIIILDEPTAHLDLNNRVEIMNLLRELSRSTHKAILMATHELDLALQTADRIWLTGKNQDILQGFPEDLVLNGSFDEIFQFKGFDLKSGRLLHHPYREVSVQLKGEGPAYLWTKNALERNGFHVVEENQDISVTVIQNASILKWIMKNSRSQIEVESIENLMKSI